MAVKTRKHFYIDAKVLDEFIEASERQGYKNPSVCVEDLIKSFLTKEDQALHDELHAPIMEGIMNRKLDKFFNQVKGMIYNQSVDVKLIPFLMLSLHKHSLEATEEMLDGTFVSEILDPNRESVADDWTAAVNGIQLLQNATGVAHKQIQKKKQADMKNNQKQEIV